MAAALSTTEQKKINLFLSFLQKWNKIRLFLDLFEMNR